MLHVKANRNSLDTFLKYFFILMFIELILGGGGRMIEFGPLSPRMIFYILAIPVAGLYIYAKEKVDPVAIGWILCFAGLLFVSSVIGIINGASIMDILEDLKPLLFFFVLPFFSISINSIDRIRLTIKILKASSLIMGLLYVITVVLLITGILDFATFYNKMSEKTEIYFRSPILFFYKGFIYLCIGFFFFLCSKGRVNKLCALFLFFCIVLTYTRGFILSTVLVTLFYYLFIYPNKQVSLVLLVIGIIAISLVFPIFLESLGDRSESDLIRYLQFEQVIDKVNGLNLVLGDGLGIGIPIRKDHMEISYLEIFSKQGIMGLAFWLSLFGYIGFLYLKLYNNRFYFLYLTPFFLSTLLIFIQSATNPYLNNPIGLSMVLISLVVFRKIDFYKKNIR